MRNGKLAVIDVTTKKVRKLLKLRPPWGPSTIAWSPDSTQMLVVWRTAGPLEVPQRPVARPDQSEPAQAAQRATAANQNGEGRTRTGDTPVFSRVLYQLSYLAAAGRRSV